MTAGTWYATRLSLLLLIAVLGAGLIWGLTGVFAADPSAGEASLDAEDCSHSAFDC